MVKINKEEREKLNKKALKNVLSSCYICGYPCVLVDGCLKCCLCGSEFVNKEGVIYG